MRPTTAQLEALITVTETGSISTAAQVLGLAQPTVSATLARLERSAGTALLHRTTSGTRLTTEGEMILALAQEALTALDEVGAALEGLRAAPAPVRIAASYTVAEQLLPVWLTGAEVGTQVEVCNSQAVQDRVLSGRAEVGFIEGAGASEQLESRLMGRDELVLVVGPGHPWARREPPVGAEELLHPTSCGTLVLREPGSGARKVLEEALGGLGLTVPADAPVLGSTSAILTAVRHSGAHAVVPHAAAEGFVGSGELRTVPVGLDLRRRLLLVLPRARRRRPGVERLLAHFARAVDGRQRPPIRPGAGSAPFS
ncbi:LysR family transcriptional regulator [Actinomyces gaoshouyii]|uniref:LysR family transcriptional regulator n=1 Tax=Actinomyces gaoshouyii TaxID=1960083 RepID=UPI0009BDE15B|nr:LysR family transcriptional regulator [Actinomyces gaoshouyii]ARD40986.1 hypothetical protein B6G06_00130 [Actinomyces gaoshouyii]